MYKVFHLRVPPRQIDPQFFLHLLKSALLVERYRSLGKGSVKRRKSISFGQFALLHIPIPPLQTQKSIAKKAVRLGRLRHQTERVAQSIDKQVHSLLEAAGLD